MSGDAERMFYILCMKEPRGDEALWWGPNNNGYTVVLDRAGKYTESQVRENQRYYDDGKDNRAIPCDLVDPLVVRVVPRETPVVRLAKKQHIRATT